MLRILIAEEVTGRDAATGRLRRKTAASQDRQVPVRQDLLILAQRGVLHPPPDAARSVTGRRGAGQLAVATGGECGAADLADDVVEVAEGCLDALPGGFRRQADGGVQAEPSVEDAGDAGEGKLVQQVIGAAYSAFYAGLRDALFVSAGLVFAAGVFTVLWFGRHHQPPAPAGRAPVLGETQQRGTAQPR